MTIEILSYKPYGPYQSINTKEEVSSLTEFIRQVRSCFDEAVTAVAVIKDGFAVALWIAEPDIDCDTDGPYEVKPAYLGQEFVRYEAASKSFWNHVARYFGADYIPDDVGFIAKFPRPAQQNSVNQYPDGAEALAALAAGNTLLAEASFEQEVEASQRLRLAAEQLAAGEGRREADAARNVASLAVVRGDLNKAVRYFQIALEANPEDLDAALQLGYALINSGEPAQAGRVFADVIQQARSCDDPRLEGWGLNGRGDVLVAQGDGPEALTAAERNPSMVG